MKKSFTNIPCDQFKAVMRRFAANVNVITSADGGLLNGMTATAVCSVTAEPPSVLVIVNKTNRSHPIIRNSGAFAVNVLSLAQQDIALHFASRVADPFSTIDFSVGKTGCPIIAGSDAYVECVVIKEVELGTHTIFLGEVVASDLSDGEPLLYHGGQYRRLEQAQDAFA